MSEKKAGARFGCSAQTVCNILRDAEVAARPWNLSAALRKTLIEEYQRGESSVALARAYGVDKSTICRLVREAGIKARGSRKWHFDQSFFTAKKPQTAYWMGFLMADGAIQQIGSALRLSLSVHQRDKGHLAQFCEAIGLPCEAIRECVRTDPFRKIPTPMATVVMSFPKFREWLAPWGIVPRKTYNFVAPNIGRRLYPAYLRGWFDGDGYIGESKYGCLSAVLVNHEREALEWYASALQAIGFSGKASLHYQKNQTGGCWRLYVSRKRDILALAEVLSASEAPCLKRKWEKILDRPRDYFDQFEATPEIVAEFVRLYESSLSTGEIAERYHVSSGTVYRHLRDAGVRIRSARLTKAQEQKVLALYDEGWDQYQVADKFAISQTTVSDVLARNGIEARPRGNRTAQPASDAGRTRRRST